MCIVNEYVCHTLSHLTLALEQASQEARSLRGLLSGPIGALVTMAGGGIVDLLSIGGDGES
jgi:hypothetical protein